MTGCFNAFYTAEGTDAYSDVPATTSAPDLPGRSRSLVLCKRERMVNLPAWYTFAWPGCMTQEWWKSTLFGEMPDSAEETECATSK